MTTPQDDPDRQIEEPTIEAIRKILAEQVVIGPGFLTGMCSGGCIGAGNGVVKDAAPTLADIELLIGKVKPTPGLDEADAE